jgi:hypothetical protein
MYITADKKIYACEGAINHISTHQPFCPLWLHFNYWKYSLEAQYEYINLINGRLSIVPNLRDGQTMRRQVK